MFAACSVLAAQSASLPGARIRGVPALGVWIDEPDRYGARR
jgi:hypothetical protein